MARFILWAMAVPGRLRVAGRRLGPMPVTVFVVMLALLGSGGLLYGVGAFDEPTKKPHSSAAVSLEPSRYKASCTASPSTTAAGKKVTFSASHLVDGETSTAWRCAGKGDEQRVTLTFDRPVDVTKVALVPGWATRDKTSKANRFAENGAPTVVTWRFDESSVKQRIGKPKPAWAQQTLKSTVRTKTVTLTIDSIRPGNRKAMVAVSEIRLTGHRTDT